MLGAKKIEGIYVKPYEQDDRYFSFTVSATYLEMSYFEQKNQKDSWLRTLFQRHICMLLLQASNFKHDHVSVN